MEDEIRTALRRAGQHVHPSADERARIRRKMLASTTEDGPPAAGGVDDAPVIELGRREAGPRQRRRLIAAAAAVIALVAGSVLLLRGQESADIVVDTATNSTTSPAVQEAPPGACAAALAVTEALIEWRTVEAWARVGRADPDLGGRTTEALDRVTTGPDDQATVEANELGALLDESAERPGEFVDERRASIEQAFALIIDRLNAYDDPTDCDLSVLRAAVDR